MNKAIRSFCLSKHSHRSKSEATYCNRLLSMKQQKEILDYEMEVKVSIKFGGKKFCDWAVDFRVIELDGSESWHECKGYNFSDDSFKLKRDAFLLCFPDKPLYVNWVLAEMYESPKKMRARIKRLQETSEDYRNKANAFRREQYQKSKEFKKEKINGEKEL